MRDWELIAACSVASLGAGLLGGVALCDLARGEPACKPSVTISNFGDLNRCNKELAGLLAASTDLVFMVDQCTAATDAAFNKYARCEAAFEGEQQ